MSNSGESTTRNISRLWGSRMGSLMWHIWAGFVIKLRLLNISNSKIFIDQYGELGVNIQPLSTPRKCFPKHHKNCKCCPVSLFSEYQHVQKSSQAKMFKDLKVVKNGTLFSQSSLVSFSRYKLELGLRHLTLIKCLKGHTTLGSLFVNVKLKSTLRLRRPVELFRTGKIFILPPSSWFEDNVGLEETD